MRTRRSNTQVSSQNQISKFENRDTAPYDATCITLNFDSVAACEACACNIDNLCKASSRKKSKFRHASQRNRCEQRWCLKCISGLNAPINRYLTHIDVCEKLGIEPHVRLEKDEIIFSSNLQTTQKRKQRHHTLKLFLHQKSIHRFNPPQIVAKLILLH